jgi:hypothetical protein
MRLFRQSLGILGTCMREAPEFSARRRRQAVGGPAGADRSSGKP